MSPTSPSHRHRHRHDRTTGTRPSQSRSNEQRVNTIATPPGLVSVPAPHPTNGGGC
jgi:hypothetical protein